MAIDFNYVSPWKDIETVAVDGQEMVRIPKFYVKTGYHSSGSLAGKRYWQVSNKNLDGFHLHPAFMLNGQEMDCFYYGAYEASNADDPNGTSLVNGQKVYTGHKAASLPNVKLWNYIFLEEARTACEARNVGGVTGFHITNFYEVDALAILILIEYGSTDIQGLIGAGRSDQTWTTSGNQYGDDKTVRTGTSNAVWRGIHEMWGNVWEHVDGCYTDNSGQLYVWDNKGNHTYQATGATYPAGGSTGTGNNGKTYKNGYTLATLETEGENFDLKDSFFPKELAAEVENSTYQDYGQWMSQNNYGTTASANYRPATHLFVSGGFHDGAYCGPFTRSLSRGTAYADDGFRLGKYGTAVS